MRSVTDLTHDSTRRELATDAGVLRYHEAGDGPPLLLLHGSGPGVTGWRNFGDNLAAFAPHFRCLVLELPGFGVSEALRAVAAHLRDVCGVRVQHLQRRDVLARQHTRLVGVVDLPILNEGG